MLAQHAHPAAPVVPVLPPQARERRARAIVLEECGAQHHLEATLPQPPVELLVLAVRHGGIESADCQERLRADTRRTARCGRDGRAGCGPRRSHLQRRGVTSARARPRARAASRRQAGTLRPLRPPRDGGRMRRRPRRRSVDRRGCARRHARRSRRARPGCRAFMASAWFAASETTTPMRGSRAAHASAMARVRSREPFSTTTTCSRSPGQCCADDRVEAAVEGVAPRPARAPPRTRTAADRAFIAGAPGVQPSASAAAGRPRARDRAPA